MGFGKANVHVSVPLTNFALQYVQEASMFVADKACPQLPVGKEADKYFTFDRANWRTRDTLRAAGAVSNRTNMPVLATDSYNIEEYSLHEYVSQREIDNADNPLSPRQDASASIMEQLMIDKELKVCATIFTTTAANSSVTLSTTVQWSYTQSTSPIDDIDVGRFAIAQQIGKMPNQAVTGAQVWQILRNHEDILDRIKYVQKGVTTTDLVASLLDLDEMLVGMAVQMTTNTGIASEATAYIWGKDLLLHYAQTRPALKSVSHAYQFTKRGGGVQVKEWWDNDHESYKIEGSAFYDKKVVSTYAAYMMKAVVV